MTKQKFLMELRTGLSGLPQKDIEERLTFYSEMIEDRIEDGLSEEQAVLAVGTAKEIVAQTVAEIPLAKIAKERIKSNRRFKAWEIVLLALGSPIWLSLGIALVAVILSVYVSLWSVIISLWAAFVSLVASSFGGVMAGILFSIKDNLLTGIAVCGASIVCLGFSIFMFYGCKAASKGILILTKKIAILIKNCFIKKEEA